MKTHILIPIEDIESKINYYKLTIKRCDELNLKNHEYYRTQGFLTIFESLLDEYKQGHLDEVTKEPTKEPTKEFQNWVQKHIEETSQLNNFTLEELRIYRLGLWSMYHKLNKINE